MKKKQKTSGDRKVYHFRISSMQLACIAACALMVCFWMFVLGVLTGRGVIFNKVPWLALDSNESLETPAGGKEPNKEPERVNQAEVLKPEKIEKQLEFFHNVDRSRVREENKQGSVSRPVSKKPGHTVGPEPPLHHNKKFFILVASFRKKDMANTLAKKLVKFGYMGKVEKVDLREKGTWFRVCVGNYSGKDEAKKHARIIEKKLRVSPLVMVTSN